MGQYDKDTTEDCHKEILVEFLSNQNLLYLHWVPTQINLKLWVINKEIIQTENAWELVSLKVMFGKKINVLHLFTSSSLFSFSSEGLMAIN